MSKIRKPMGIDELELKPPIDGEVRLSDDMQQTLALLTAMGVSGRKLMKCSESGILYIASPRIKDVVHFTGVGANDTQTGDNMVCSELLVIAHPDNTGLIWVRPYKTASANNAIPLSAKESADFTLDNMNQLNMLIVVAGEKVIVAYSI